jgi:hypothetical protein
VLWNTPRILPQKTVLPSIGRRVKPRGSTRRSRHHCRIIREEERERRKERRWRGIEERRERRKGRQKKKKRKETRGNTEKGERRSSIHAIRSETMRHLVILTPFLPTWIRWLRCGCFCGSGSRSRSHPCQLNTAKCFFTIVRMACLAVPTFSQQLGGESANAWRPSTILHANS